MTSLSALDEVTLSVIKADVGSPGGHTRPTEAMLEVAQRRLAEQRDAGFLRDFDVTFTGDDTALTMVHTHGDGNHGVHQLAWGIFKEMTAVAEEEGLYAAGQDLLLDAPSGNIRGAGPGVAEITFPMGRPYRRAEAVSIWTGDKCAPGAFNLPVFSVFANGMHNTGLLLNPALLKGFVVTVLDMNYTAGDRVIRLNLPEEHLQLLAVLRNPDRFAIRAIHSRAQPEEQIVSIVTDRLHNVKGVYTGKDDPAAIIRSQGIFPAPEELVHPWLVLDMIVAGDCRGSHHMYITPMPINSEVTGAYCSPIMSCVVYSINRQGILSQRVDIFGNPAWDHVRDRIGQANARWRLQGPFGPAMVSQEEQAYTGLKELDATLDTRFEVVTTDY